MGIGGGTVSSPMTATTGSQGAGRARADRAWDVVVVVVANAIVLLGLWLRHGGLDTLDGAGGPAVAAGGHRKWFWNEFRAASGSPDGH